MPTPHLERPSLFEYTLPVPISELGIRPVRDPRPVRQPVESFRRDEPIRESHIPSASDTPRSVSGNRDENAALGKRISSFATLIFGGQQQAAQSQPQQNRAVHVPSARSSPAEHDRDQRFDDDIDDDEVISAARPNEEQITRFGNIIVRNEQSDIDKTMMKTVRRTAAVANINDIDRSFANAAPSA